MNVDVTRKIIFKPSSYSHRSYVIRSHQTIFSLTRLHTYATDLPIAAKFRIPRLPDARKDVKIIALTPTTHRNGNSNEVYNGISGDKANLSDHAC